MTFDLLYVRGKRSREREVEGPAPPRIEAPTPGTKSPSGPVEALQHPLCSLDAAGRFEYSDDCWAE